MKNNGFTLVELIIAIVILGVLGGLIVPRFANLKSEANKAAVEGLAGAVKSATTLIHAKAVIKHQNILHSGSITIKGQTINLIYGFPVADDIVKVIEGHDGFTFRNTTQTGGAFSRFESKKANSGVFCSVTYSPSQTTNQYPVINTDHSGC